MYIVYILKSLKSNKYYIGFTKDIEDRLLAHNSGKSIWSRRYKPWKVVYTETFETKTKALEREKEIKGYKGGNSFKKLIK